MTKSLMALAAALCLSTPALAADTPSNPALQGVPGEKFPSRPLRMVIPLAPGGGSDIVGRIVALALAEHWAVPVVVDNRPGAGSTVGTAIVAKALADGYTILLSSSSVAISPALYRHLDFDTQRDLTGVSLLASQPSLLAVHHSVPVSSIVELIAHAKARPQHLAFGSAGKGSATHLGGELLKFNAGIELLHVPYKSAGLATTALLAGEVQVLMTNMASVLPYHKSGKIRVLAITSHKRSPAAPDIPTLAEAGVPKFEYSTWYGMLAPARTARNTVARLHAATAAVLSKPPVRDRLTAQGMDLHATSPDSFQAYFEGELRRWDRIIKAAGIPVE